jgi:hypothetical protein
MLLSKICEAKTRSGTPCRRPTIPGKSRCALHGGHSAGPVTPEGKARSEAAKLAGAARWREKMRAKIVLGMAARFPSGRKSNTERERFAAARAPQVPEWPRDGYAGSDDARRLEASEREFIRELAAPLDLEMQLLRTGRSLSRLSRYETEQLLTVFVETMRREVEHHLDELAAAEAEFRRPDDAGATAMRLARLRFEADAYLNRLGTERAILIVAAEDRERQAQARGADVSERIVHGRDLAAEQRANRPREELVQLTIDPRRKEWDGSR